MNIIVDIAKKYDVKKVYDDYDLKKQVILKMRNILKANDVLTDDRDSSVKLDFIYMFEGLRLAAYYEKTSRSVSNSYCPNSCIAVGCGFNMSRYEAKAEWNKVLPVELFDAVYNGRMKITLDDCSKLLALSLSVRERELIKIFDEDLWFALPDYIAIVLESLYYNIPGFIRGKSDLIECALRRFLDTKKESELYVIGTQMLMYKHSVLHESLHQRRRLECLLLCGKDKINELCFNNTGKKDYLDDEFDAFNPLEAIYM